MRDPLDHMLDSIMSDTSPMTEEDQKDADAALDAVRRAEWVVDVTIILSSPPYSWTEEQAESYARSLVHDYYTEGFDPWDAVSADSQYWDD